MESSDVSSDVMADNTLPLTTIPMGSPRGEPVWRINKMLLEVEKSLSLGIDATKLRKSGAEEEEEEVRKKEKGKEKEWNRSEGSLHYEMRWLELEVDSCENNNSNWWVIYRRVMMTGEGLLQISFFQLSLSLFAFAFCFVLRLKFYPSTHHHLQLLPGLWLVVVVEHWLTFVSTNK